MHLLLSRPLLTKLLHSDRCDYSQADCFEIVFARTVRDIGRNADFLNQLEVLLVAIPRVR
jgi:hypothetical protein